MIVNGYKIKQRAYLQSANLQSANLFGANLSKTNLFGANLRYANLWTADLRSADLRSANLESADLRSADLFRADLSEANLFRADLRSANLFRSDLSGANLQGTCLDPENIPNGDVVGFERCGRYVIGYRTRKAGHIGMYRDGRTYTANFFSVANTECHPGLYIWPTLWQSKLFSRMNVEHIRVYVLPEDVHHAGIKYRCRMFQVIGSASGE